MKKIVIALALVLTSSSFVVANAGARKTCKQGLEMHPMAGEHSVLMKECKAQYKALKKAGHTPRVT